MREARWFQRTSPRTQKAESALSGVRRPSEPNFRPPFERISDPQIPLTRRDSRVASLFAAVSTAMTSPCCGVHSTHPVPQLETSFEGSEGGGGLVLKIRGGVHPFQWIVPGIRVGISRFAAFGGLRNRVGRNDSQQKMGS